MEMWKLPPEPQSGNVEYKYKIVNPSKTRLDHLTSQMKWRLREGQGEAIYEIGVKDNGLLEGLPDEEMEESLRILREMASKLGASVTVLQRKINWDSSRSIAEVLLKVVPEDQDADEIRLGVLGNAGAGKSTLLGVLTHGSLDNGKGKARLNMFRHLHEIQSGRTSSISQEVLGFNSNGNPVNYKGFMCKEEICDFSSKIITFFDLAGHRKYLKTTLQGFFGYSPHYAILVLSSMAGVVEMAEEYLLIAVALKINFFIVITMIDLLSPSKVFGALREVFKRIGCKKLPLKIKSVDDITYQSNRNVVPIFCVSSVTGEGLNLLLKFLYLLPSGMDEEKRTLEQELTEFQIDEIFRGGCGQILSGLLTRGVLIEGTEMQIGPKRDGTFDLVTIKSVYRNKIPRRVVKAGQCATLCLENEMDNLRNGMVLLSKKIEACSCLFFQAKVSLIFQASPIPVGSQVSIYLGNIRQTVRIVGIFSGSVLKGETSVVFKFQQHPEFLRVGRKLFFSEGRCKGFGEVTQIFEF